MANKNIKGITIKIGGDTTELTKALKDVNGVIAKSNSELKSFNQALKLDPKNTELLAQKQEVLKNNIKATADRLNTLKEAQRQMGNYNSLTDEQKESYRALSVEISKTESSLKGMNKELKESSGINLDKLKEGLKKVGDVAADVAKKMLEVSAAVAGALAGVVTAGVKSFAELEKAQKGSQRLFGDAFGIVEQNAAEAYKSMGLSASQYYDQVNTYAVGLKDALNGDSEAAAKLSNDILVAQADIVAATGADAEAVSNAFAAVMRGNYTMIDNLRLGVKGSKEGMQEVIDKVNEWRKANGDTTELVMGNYADMQQALVDYVKMQGIAGTAEDQMSKTIIGSVTQMKAAFDNFLNGSGSPEALGESLTNVFKNISEAISKLAPSILSGIVSLVQTLIPQVVSMLTTLLPQLMDAVSNIIDQLLNMLKSNTDGIAETVSELINKFVEFITTNLPKILEIALLLIETLAKGLIDSLPTIINSAMELLFSIIDTILDHLDEVIDLAVTLIETLAISLIDALPKLLQKVPEIIVKLVDALTKPEMLAKIIKAALVLIIELARGLIIALPELLKMPQTIIQSLVDKIKERISSTDWGALGSNIIRGICDGFGRIGSYISQKVNEVKDQVVSKFKSIFGIHSPSKLMADTIGFNISAGIGEGIEEGIPSALQDVNAAMKQLNAGIEASVNPTINPSMTYESNYMMMANAMKLALSDMVVELDDENMGKFVVKTVTDEIYN